MEWNLKVNTELLLYHTAIKLGRADRSGHNCWVWTCGGCKNQQCEPWEMIWPWHFDVGNVLFSWLGIGVGSSLHPIFSSQNLLWFWAMVIFSDHSPDLAGDKYLYWNFHHCLLWWWMWGCWLLSWWQEVTLSKVQLTLFWLEYWIQCMILYLSSILCHLFLFTILQSLHLSCYHLFLLLYSDCTRLDSGRNKTSSCFSCLNHKWEFGFCKSWSEKLYLLFWHA